MKLTSPALTLDQANAVLDVVIEAGIFEPPKPTDKKSIIKSAGEVIVQAETAKRAGVTTPAVLKVIEIGLDIPFSLSNNEDTEPAAIPNGDIARFDDESPVVPPPLPIDNGSHVDTAAVSTDAKLIESDQEKESTSQNPLDDIPTLPRDFSTVSDLELRSLHATRFGVLSKVIHELGLEESDYQSAQMILDHEFRQAKALYPELKAHDKIDAAHISDEVIKWRLKVDEHHKKVTMLRAYKEILETEIKGLSREYTMRESERGSTP